MKYLYLLLIITICTLSSPAQLSLKNYALTESDFENATILNASKSDYFTNGSISLSENDYNKRRRKYDRFRRGPYFVIKTNLTNIIVISPTITYERIISEDITLSGSIIFTYMNFKRIATKYIGPKFCFDLRYYVGHDAPAGLFIGAYTYFNSYTMIMEGQYYIDPITYETYNEYKATLLNYGLGVIWGYQIMTRFGMIIDLYGGIGVGGHKFTIKQGENDDFNFGPLANLSGRGGISIGWAF